MKWERFHTSLFKTLLYFHFVKTVPCELIINPTELYYKNECLVKKILMNEMRIATEP